MKLLPVLASLLLALPGLAQSIPSDVYVWEKLPVVKRDKMEQRQVLSGNGAAAHLDISAVTLYPDAVPPPAQTYPEEVMLIVQEGRLTIRIGTQSRTMGPGSVAVALPGEEIAVENAGDSTASYYVFRYQSDKPDMARAKNAGGSFFSDWNDLKFTAHDKGGVRQYFNRPTAMLKKLDIHVTTLNPGIKSHEPHTHRAEEIVLMISGNAEMEIAGKLKKASTGDLIYLESTISHAIRNSDTQPILYFAIQWE